MRMNEPSLESIEDFNGNEAKEKRLTVWIVILSGLLVGALYGLVASSAGTVDDALPVQTGIIKY